MYRSGELRLEAISCRKKQAGAALLVIMLLLTSAVSFLFVRKLNYVASARTADIRTTTDALIEAKNALLGFAATYPDKYGATDPLAGPGFLPCPDTNGDGSPNPPCVANQMGRFPWSFIGISEFFDGSGERLWYSLSGNFRNNPKTFPLNSETPGQLVIDGTIGDVVAVIIAPGEPIVNLPAINQQRSSDPNDVTNYLEGDNANGDANFVTSGAPGSFNDRVVYITRQDLMGMVEKRVLGEIRQILRTYYQNSDPAPANRFYPYAAALGTRVGVEGLRQGFLPLSPPPPIPPPPGPSTHPNPTISVPSWFTNPPGTPTPTNDWEQFVYYAIGTDCTFANKGCNSTTPSDFLTVGTRQGIHALVISAGQAITAAPYAVSKGGAQDRTSPPPQPANEYLDSVENTDSDDTYDAVGTQITPSYNDQIKIVAP